MSVVQIKTKTRWKSLISNRNITDRAEDTVGCSGKQ